MLARSARSSTARRVLVSSAARVPSAELAPWAAERARNQWLALFSLLGLAFLGLAMWPLLEGLSFASTLLWARVLLLPVSAALGALALLLIAVSAVHRALGLDELA